MRDSTAQQKRHALWLRTKKIKLTKGDIRVRTRGNLTALAWKDRWNVYLLTNMDPPPEEGNFCDESKRGVMPQIMAQYNRHMGYVDISDRMVNSYSMCRRTFKWTTKLFFHLLDLTVLKSWILLLHVGLNVPTKISDYFGWGIWSRKLEEAIIAPPPVCLVGQVRLQQMLWGRTAAITSNGQQNTKTISAPTFVQRGVGERPPFTNVPNAMWVCVWCRVSLITTQKQICKAVYN